MRLPTSIALAMTLVACSADGAIGPDSSLLIASTYDGVSRVRMEISAGTYAAGGSVTIRITNPTQEEMYFSDCAFTLQGRINSSWYAVPRASAPYPVRCVGGMANVPSGTSVTVVVRLSPELRAGSYRFENRSVEYMAWNADFTAGKRSVEPIPPVTNEFAVVR